MKSDLYNDNIEKMQNFYLDTERQFIELSYIIPLDNDVKTYSPRLYNIFQSTCGQILNMGKIICDRIGLKYKKDDFPTFYSILNSKRLLEKQRVIVIPIKKEVFPFEINGRKIPHWWSKYNNTKHKLPKGLYEGNIGNTINALAALYLLHGMSYYVKHHIPVEFLEPKKWAEPIRVDMNRISIYKVSGIVQPFDSEIFWSNMTYGGEYHSN